MGVAASHSFIQQTFVPHLLCAWPGDGQRGHWEESDAPTAPWDSQACKHRCMMSCNRAVMEAPAPEQGGLA